MIHSSIIPRGMKYKMVIFKNPLPPEITNIFFNLYYHSRYNSVRIIPFQNQMFLIKNSYKKSDFEKE